MDFSSEVSFLGIAALITLAAWQPHFKLAGRFIRALHLNYLALYGTISFIAIAWFIWIFFRSTEAFPILFQLMELAGVIFLAREVYFAQEFEEYRRTAEALKPFVDLEPLAAAGNFETYAREYYKLDGRSTDDADRDISIAKQIGNLDTQVNQLKESARHAYERPKGPLAVEAFKYRRKRLLLGVVLIAAALARHGLHLLTH